MSGREAGRFLQLPTGTFRRIAKVDLHLPKWISKEADSLIRGVGSDLVSASSFADGVVCAASPVQSPGSPRPRRGLAASVDTQVQSSSRMRERKAVLQCGLRLLIIYTLNSCCMDPFSFN